MTMLLAQMATPDMWDKYGLPGLVIFTLFLTLGFLGRLALSTWRKSEQDRNKVEEERNAMFNSLISQHQQERKEWREDADEARRDNITALKEVSAQTQQTYRELSKETVLAMKEHTEEIRALRTGMERR